MDCFKTTKKCVKACFDKDDTDGLLFVDVSDIEEEGKDDKVR